MRKIKRMGRDLEKIEFNDFIVDRAKSQQENDTQIDRSDGEFRKNETPEEIHELGGRGISMMRN